MKDKSLIAPNGEEILMIEYHDGVPHSVYTTYSNFDFAMHVDGWLMYYDSGGGVNTEFDVRTTCWVNPTFKGEVKVGETGVILDKPLRVGSDYSYLPKTSINPFKVADEVEEIQYCARCDGYLDGMCEEHQYWCDEDGVVKYIDNDEEA